MPKRIQRKRTKGWRKPEGAVIVDRTTGWGNPFVVGKGGQDPAAVVEKYRDWINGYESNAVVRRQLAKLCLAGKDLCCWCPLDQPCHADVLLEIANRDDSP